MNRFFHTLNLQFLPRSADFALLVLRVWFGLSLLVLHGWGKLANFNATVARFSDPLGLGPTVSVTLVVAAEVFGSALIVLGFCTRLAALACAVTMAVAFTFAHGGRLSGQGNGELSFLFLGAFVTLLIGGAGRFSLDARLARV